MAIQEDLALIITSNGIGEGATADLGEKLLGSYLKTLLESERLPARIIFMNAGIFATTEGTSYLETLQGFEAAGTEILSCLTCLKYFDRVDKLVVGKQGNMRDTVEASLGASKVLTF
jgi:selenium metabolism protein YedF